MILEPKKRYKQNVQNAYQITQAVLDIESSGKGHSDVLLTIGENTFILCTLTAASPQTPLNMRLAQGDQISFATRGEGTIHLTGYILEGAPAAAATNGRLAIGDSKKAAKNQKNSQKKDDLKRLLEKTISDDEDDSDDADFSQLMASMDGLEEDDDDSGEEEEDDDEMGDDDSDDDEQGGGDEEDDSDLGDEEEDDDDEDDSEEEEAAVKEPPTKKGKKELPQKKEKEQKPQEKNAKKEKPAAAAQTNGVAQDGKPQTLAGGVKIKDTKVGTGAFAKPGKTVVVYYEGRLQSNNKMFDSCKQGAGFNFQLGRGAVIRGWDVGVAGMRVGGKRQIVCPPGAAYGQRGSPPVIPPNSTLVFEVELRKVQ